MNPATPTTDILADRWDHWSEQQCRAASDIYYKQVQLHGSRASVAAALWLLFRIPGDPWASGRSYDLLTTSAMHGMRVMPRWGWEQDQIAMFFICRMFLNDGLDTGLRVLLTALNREEGDLVATAVRIATGAVQVPGFEEGF